MYLIHLDFELGFFMSLDYAYEFSNLQFVSTNEFTYLLLVADKRLAKPTMHILHISYPYDFSRFGLLGL